MTALLESQQLCKSFVLGNDNEYTALNNVDLTIDEGEFVAIIGNTPAMGLFAPMGRADAILSKVGKIYCEECFKKRYTRREEIQ